MSCQCGQVCLVPSWAADGSWYSNNPSKFTHAVALAHRWFEPARVAAVEVVRAETRSLVLAPTYPCVICRQHSFNRDGVTCYWCGRKAVPS